MMCLYIPNHWIFFHLILVSDLSIFSCLNLITFLRSARARTLTPCTHTTPLSKHTQVCGTVITCVTVAEQQQQPCKRIYHRDILNSELSNGVGVFMRGRSEAFQAMTILNRLKKQLR